MNLASPTVPARYFALLCDHLDAAGIDTAWVLERCCIDRAALEDIRCTLATAQQECFLEAAQQAGAGIDLAFELGHRMRLSSHDMLGYALISSASLDLMLRLMARYQRLINPLLQMNVQRDGSTVHLQFRPSAPMSPTMLTFWLEATAVGMVQQLKTLPIARTARFEVNLSIAAPAHLARYAELGSTMFRFAATPLPEVQITLKGVDPDAALPNSDGRAAAMAESRCIEQLRHQSQTWRVSDWMSMMLRHSDEHQPSLHHFARLLNVTTRTLDRYLHKEGTSFRELSTTIRNQRACALLDEGRLTISQIAYTLGYTDIGNFSRSFKKVCGVSPRGYKESGMARHFDAGVATSP